MIRYNTPGQYVAICNNETFTGHYVKVFDLPEVKSNLYEGNISAISYFIMEVDHNAHVEAVYPIGIFHEKFLIEMIHED